MLDIIIGIGVIFAVLAFGSWLIDRTPTWLFYSLVVPALMFMLWKVGAVEWLFNA